MSRQRMVPSRRAPVFIRIFAAWRVCIIVMSSSRDLISFTGVLGRKLGTLATAGAVGTLSWWITASMLVAAGAGVIALVVVGVMGVGSGRGGRSSGGPVIWGGGGGGGGGGVPQFTEADALAVACWFYVVVAGTLIGYTAYMVLLECVSPALASSYAFVNPVIGMTLGVYGVRGQVRQAAGLAGPRQSVAAAGARFLRRSMRATGIG